MQARLIGTRLACVAVLTLTAGACASTGSAQPDPSPSSLASASPSPSPPTLGQIKATSRSGVARIEVTDCDGTVASGSGFLVDENLVVTAAHVVQDVHSVSVRTSDGVSRGEVLGIDSEHDVALLRTVHPFPGGHLFDFSTTPAQPEDQVSLLGYPLGLPLTSATGTVQGVNRRLELDDQSVVGLLQLQLPADHGDSGGPIFDDSGDVVGLLTLGRDKGDQIIYAVPAETAAPLVASWLSTPDPVPTRSCDPWAPEVRIKSVHPDAPAIAATLYKYFDSINSGDYEAAWTTISGDLRGQFENFADFADGLNSATDSDVNLEKADMTNETTDTADVRFTSRQDENPASDVQVCTLWHFATPSVSTRGSGPSWTVQTSILPDGATPVRVPGSRTWALGH